MRRYIQFALVLAATLPLWGAGVVQAQATTVPNPEIVVDVDAGVVYPGGVVSFSVKIENPSNIRLRHVLVDLAFAGTQLVPIGSQFVSDDDWVTDLQSDRLRIRFGNFGKGSKRAGTIVFKVRENVPVGSSIRVRGSYEWERDRRDLVGLTGVDREDQGNTTPEDVVVVAPLAPPIAAVQPTTAPSGATLFFTAARYVPGEAVSFWVNAPGGTVLSVDTLVAASAAGTVSFAYTAPLANGAYTMVIFGNLSRQTAVVPFTIGTTPAAPAAPATPRPAPGALPQP